MIGFYYIKIIDGANPTIIDAFSWTIVTLSTLGSYNSDLLLDTPLGKLFTSIIVILGITVFFIGAPLVIVPWIEKQVKNVLKPKPLPIPLKNHVIICGYNDLIDEVIDSLKLHGFPYLIIDKRSLIIDLCREKQIPFIEGDPMDEDILLFAHIKRAISLITSLDDEQNAFVCLTAKGLKEDVRIIAIAQKTRNVKTLYTAGANRVLNPKLISGSILGRRACHDFMIEVSGKFAKFGDLEIRQYAITSSSIIIDMSIRDLRVRSRTGAIIIGLWIEGNLVLNPSAEKRLALGTTVLVMGTDNQLDSFYKLVEGYNIW
jgi:voltage-gated potassium channel